MYAREQVVFLPNIEKIPSELSWSKKAKRPTICFVGRLDVRKRPELVFELAAQLPDYDFIIVGKAEEVERQRDLEAQALRYKNIQMVGFLDKFSDELRDIYQRSWILLNTSAREGLPLTFVEAAAYGCAIVSYVNPDSFASTFGYWAKNGDYEFGLKYLVENDHWRQSGQKGYEYVKETYSQKAATEEHLKIYKQLLSDS
jgi:glycosyltransferase involved in cell wall biosynthesis